MVSYNLLLHWTQRCRDLLPNALHYACTIWCFLCLWRNPHGVVLLLHVSFG